VHASDLATVIYTSGTTGPPKGVMITQRNLAYTVAMMKRAGLDVDPDFIGSRIVSYLPMAHIAERLTTHYSGIAGRYEVTCLAEVGELAATLRAVRPNVMLGVPRVWEKLHAGLVAALSADPAKYEQFEKGMAAAMPIVLAKALGRATDAELATLAFLDEAGFAPLRAVLGLDALRIAVTSAGAHRAGARHVVPGTWCSAERAVRHVRDERSDDLGRRAPQAGHGRTRDPRLRGAPRP